MTRFAAALMVSVSLAGQAAAQLAAPTPRPLPSDPRVTPSRVPSDAGAEPREFVPQATLGLPVAVPPLRVPASFANEHGPTGDVDPTTMNSGCATCKQDAGSGTGSACAPVCRVWAEVDYILWKTRGDNVPALVTTSPTGTAAAQAGVLGTPGARTLVGAAGFGDDFRSGLRYNVGFWFSPQQTFGLQVGGFFLDDTATVTTLSSNGDPILARPFLNAINGAASSQLIALPGTFAGSVAVDHHNSVNGFDAALRGNMCCGPSYRLDALLGYRYLHLADGLAVTESLVAGANAPGSLGVPIGTNIVVADHFHTTNTFNGLQTGISGEYRFWERWILSGTGKASFGWIDRVADIGGVTAVAVPGQAAVQNVGGLYALSSNIGHYAQSDAVIIPEANLNLGLQLSRNLRVRIGYSLLYISSVVRPGTIIDTIVNPALIPPPTGNPVPARPTIQTERSDFILHGLSGGLELRF